MQFKHFCISLQGMESSEYELNRFLQSHRILSVEKKWIKEGKKRVLVYIVEYFGEIAQAAAGKRESKDRVDYRKLLTKEGFALFSRLRTKREELAKKANIKLYEVFLNDQLAAIVEKKVLTKSELAEIPGVGDARVEKYGEEILGVVFRKHLPNVNI